MVIYIDQVMYNFFHKKSDNKYFGLCRLNYLIIQNYSTLFLKSESIHRPTYNWVLTNYRPKDEEWFLFVESYNYDKNKCNISDSQSLLYLWSGPHRSLLSQHKQMSITVPIKLVFIKQAASYIWLKSCNLLIPTSEWS